MFHATVLHIQYLFPYFCLYLLLDIDPTYFGHNSWPSSGD